MVKKKFPNYTITPGPSCFAFTARIPAIRKDRNCGEMMVLANTYSPMRGVREIRDYVRLSDEFGEISGVWPENEREALPAAHDKICEQIHAFNEKEPVGA